MELRNHPDNHDIDQRKLRMGKLENGIPVVLDYQDYERILIKGQKAIDKPIGRVKSEIVGKYVLTPEVSNNINQRLDNIYKYNFPPTKSYAVLVYDFILDSKNVLNNNIVYNGEPDDKKVREHVLSIMKNKSSHNASISFTQYEPVDKKDPYSPMSDEHRANYMVLLIDRNEAITVMFTSKNQWETQTFYDSAKQPIQEYIRYDQVGSHARPLPSYEKELTAVNVSKEVKESWIMEWVNSVKK